MIAARVKVSKILATAFLNTLAAEYGIGKVVEVRGAPALKFSSVEKLSSALVGAGWTAVGENVWERDGWRVRASATSLTVTSGRELQLDLPFPHDGGAGVVDVECTADELADHLTSLGWKRDPADALMWSGEIEGFNCRMLVISEEGTTTIDMHSTDLIEPYHLATSDEAYEAIWMNAELVGIKFTDVFSEGDTLFYSFKGKECPPQIAVVGCPGYVFDGYEDGLAKFVKA